MTDEEKDDLRGELQRLRERVDVLATGQAGEIADLRQAIRGLERRLMPDHRPSFSPPPVIITPLQPALPVAEELPEPVVVPEFAAVPLEEEAPAFEQPLPPEKGSFELRLGRVWLVRLGIALLVSGLVLLGNYAYQNWVRDLSAGVRLAALFLGSGLLSGAGILLGRREGMQRFGEVLLAGGLAFFYWCTFAAHHVPRLQVIGSPVVAGVLLMAAAAMIVVVSLRRESRVTAVMGLLLASYSTMLQPLGWLSALSNVVLAAAGTGLMLRAGWAATGVASMVGTYASFLWWQIGGGHGGRPTDPAALWFLPPVWALFALPGVLGISRKFSGLTERGRTWFAGVNNAAFLLLFSLLWLEQRGQDGYWLVPAVFGLVLTAMGAVGRFRDPAGGVHLAQGLGALTLAMTLKLEGYHLALGFGIQALGLSVAFRRFRGRSELAFATLAAVSAMLLSLQESGWLRDTTPLWSRALVALLLITSGRFLRDGCDGSERKDETARTVTALVFFGGVALALVICTRDLPLLWRAPAAQALALGFSAYTLLKDHARRLPEAAWAVIPCALVSLGCLPGWHGSQWWPAALCSGLALVSHALWSRRTAEKMVPTADPIQTPQVFHWLTALAVTISVLHTLRVLALPTPIALISFAVAAVATAAIGRFVILSRPLQAAASVLLVQALLLQGYPETGSWYHFVPVAAGLGIVALAGPKSSGGILARILAALSWMIAWWELEPTSWGDIISATGIAAMAIQSWRKGSIPAEAWAFLILPVVGLVSQLAGRWHPLDPAPFPAGWMVVAASFAAVVLMPVTDSRHKKSRHFLLLGVSALLAVWASRAVVWHFDWKPVAILWTALGFALVSTGLWRKLAALRHAGFALLALALVKLFAVDVWDFGAFIRVAAFLALGVALVVLGFFYNRFAEVLKKLFDGE